MNINYRALGALYCDPAPSSNGSKSPLRPPDQRAKAPKVDRAGITLQRQKFALLQNCIADLALTAIQVNFEGRAGYKADLAKLSRQYRRARSAAA